MNAVLRLYGYFRSSAAYRVRIALNLKGLAYESDYVHLTRGGGQQFSPAYMRLNPQALIPTLVDGPSVLTQSLAILEYLEEKHPSPRLLPEDLVGRARVRALALGVACDMHPLNNLRVLNYLTRDLGLNEDDKLRWYRHWIAKGFDGIEAMLGAHPLTGAFCHGDAPTLADICLVPQVFNARRFNCDLKPYPLIAGIAESCMKLPAFADAAPERQPDRE